MSRSVLFFLILMSINIHFETILFANKFNFSSETATSSKRRLNKQGPKVSRGMLIGIAASMFQVAAGNCLAEGGECCNVCRNGGEITNPEQEFVMQDQITGEQYEWSCGLLATALADVNAGSTGAPGEARYCALAQIWADRECNCSGEPVPDDIAFDPNPACDLCGDVNGVQRELDYVPSVLADELVDTGVAGRMPCGGLYYALSQNVLAEELCPIVQESAGGFCCTLPSLEELDEDTGNDNEGTDSPLPTCLTVHQECESSENQCCTGLECRTRVIGIPKVCSAARTSAGRDKHRISSGRGGAAGRQRTSRGGDRTL